MATRRAKLINELLTEHPELSRLISDSDRQRFKYALYPEVSISETSYRKDGRRPGRSREAEIIDAIAREAGLNIHDYVYVRVQHPVYDVIRPLILGNKFRGPQQP